MFAVLYMLSEGVRATNREDQAPQCMGAHVESVNTVLVAIVYMCRTRLWGFNSNRALRGVLQDAVINPACTYKSNKKKIMHGDG